MADLQLIQGEKFARTGGLKAGGLDNVGEQIGKGLEVVGKEVQEAMVKVSSWGEAEEAFNNDMQKVETDGFLAGNDIGFSEQDAASEYMTGLKRKYGDAAAKASRIENKGSAAYKNQVKIMNDVNAAAKNFAAQKDSLVASRKEYQANPGSLSVSNSFDTSSASQMGLLSGKGQWSVDEKGNIIVDGQKMSDMSALKQKSELNSLVTQVYSDTYENSLKTGAKLTDTQIETAGENVINSLINSGDPKANVASFAFDPLTGTQTLYSKDSEEGKKLAEDLKNWDSLTNEQKNEIYSQVGEKHKNLLKAQNKKGIDDYNIAKGIGSDEMIEETYYDSDRYLDALSSDGGAKVVTIKGVDFMIKDGKVGVVNADPTGKGYVFNKDKNVPLMVDGKLNYEGFSILAQGKQETRTVPKKKDTDTDTKITEATLGGESRNLGNLNTAVETETETGTETGTETRETGTDTTKLPDEARGFEPPSTTQEQGLAEEKEEEEEEETLTEELPEGLTKQELEKAQEAEDELSAIELEEALEEEKFSKPLPSFRAGVRKGEITMQDVDTKIKILNAQFKKGDISKAKYDKDIKFINEKVMPLLPDDIPGGNDIDDAMIANQLGQDKKDLDARKLNPGDFPSESERSIVEVNQEQEDELKIKEEVVNAASGTDTKKVKDQENKFVDLKGSLDFPLIGGRGNSKLFRKQGLVMHESIPGIKLQSNGLRFEVKKGSQAAAVSDGKVLAIQVGSNGTKTVMVEHEGGYITLYAPLETLNVKKGDAVNKNTSLGRLFTKLPGQKGPKTVLQFQLWKDNKVQDPSEWLA